MDSESSGRRHRRPRTTDPKVLLLDRAASAVIRLGGASVILAVLGILVYLVAVVAPLFRGATITREATARIPLSEGADAALFIDLDEYRALGLAVSRSGRLIAFDPRSGRSVLEEDLSPGAPTITAFSRPPESDRLALGFDDGSIRVFRVGFLSRFMQDDGGEEPHSVEQRLGEGEFRRISAVVEPDDSIPTDGSGTAVRLVCLRAGEEMSRLAVYTDAGRLFVNEVTRRTNLLTGEVTSDVRIRDVPLPTEPVAPGPPAFLLVTSRGDQIYLAWADGTAARFDLRDPSRPVLAERFDLTPAPGVDLTVLEFVNGEQSLIAGDSAGGTTAWFRVARQVPGGDGHRMLPAHSFEAHAAPVRVVALSQRDKTFLTGASDGSLLVRHLTSERTLARASLDPKVPLLDARLAPKGDGVLALGADGSATLWHLDNPHPEASLKSLIGKVWYEGYPEPGFTWQSSSGTDDFEPKISLVPLIFGTLKATLYSLLFAVPIALAAAIYTSEFLDPRYRSSLKSTIEMMASLPSVVLGFLAALVLAPVVESWAVAVLACFAAVPLAALGFGYAWQLLPRRIALPLSGAPALVLLVLVALAAILVTRGLTGPLERLLFHGDFQAWLDSRVGTGAPGIGLLVWPLALIGLLIADRRFAARAAKGRTPAGELLRFLAILAGSLALSWGIAVGGAALGLDPRPELFGTYVQRNALVVGFVMGFAVIPIIYTIADDALSAVPKSLRSASLACGATRWQTATRVVLPVALSGIFSALMVGLGRAVGETMIVLMAAGNTPLIDLNLFNGLRTLSANIAVELPEAVKDGTLYRVLFLSALILFAVTFVVNTIAEIVRLRFRRRSYQL